MTRALMLDIETMSTASNAAISSIGAVLFDPHGDWLGDTFHVDVCLASCKAFGLDFDPATFIWWLGREEAARQAFVQGQAGAVPLDGAIYQLARFVPKDTQVWCNGASFDFPILAAAYRAAGQTLPWHYWAEHDLRTLKNLNKDLSEVPRTGTYHHALDDAIYQARQVQHILQLNPDYDA